METNKSCIVYQNEGGFCLSKNAISITYSIKGINSKCQEYFEPYSGKELKKYFKEYKALFENKNNIEILHHGKDVIKEKEKNPDTANIILDAIWCAYILKQHEDGKEPYLIESDYVGLYTELLKMEIERLKNVISALLHLSCSNNANNDSTDAFLSQIKAEYSIKEKVSYSDKQSIIRAVMFLCYGYVNMEKPLDCQVQIDLNNLDRFMSLLKKYRGLANNANFYGKKIGRNCFCLAREGNSYFFSLSGYYDNYDKLLKHIAKDLKAYLNRDFAPCKLSDDTLCYGSLIVDTFYGEDHPKRYIDCKKIYSEEELSKLFRCCERKIFTETNNYKSDLAIYCKYAPCIMCEPAVEYQQKNRAKNHCELNFYAFAKDFNSLRKYMKKKKTLKLQKFY